MQKLFWGPNAMHEWHQLPKPAFINLVVLSPWGDLGKPFLLPLSSPREMLTLRNLISEFKKKKHEMTWNLWGVPWESEPVEPIFLLQSGPKGVNPLGGFEGVSEVTQGNRFVLLFVLTMQENVDLAGSEISRFFLYWRWNQAGLLASWPTEVSPLSSLLLHIPEAFWGFMKLFWDWFLTRDCNRISVGPEMSIPQGLLQEGNHFFT